MKKLTKKCICSYVPNIGVGAAVYAYETEPAYQDNTRVHQPTPEQIQRMNEEREVRKAHLKAADEILVTAVVTGAAASVGGPKAAGAAAAASGYLEARQQCGSCHSND